MWRRALLALAAGMSALAIAVPEARGFVVGVLAASALWLVTLRPQILTGTRSRADGGDADAGMLSRELLDGVPQWLAVHDLPVDGRTVDHVVVTPLAVLAVRRAWWGPAGEDEHARRREQAVEQARRDARAVKSLLAGRDLGFDLPVWPVVLTWGPGAEDSQVGLVDVVSGADAGAWAMAYSTGAIAPAVAERAHAGLLRARARRDLQRTKAQHARAA
jgi:hypothetical protein